MNTFDQVKQSLLVRSVQHIRKQGKPSIDSQKACRYQQDGLGCAAAPFIVEYDSGMENITFNGLVEDGKFCPMLDKDAAKEVWFVNRLQDAHDGAVREMAKTREPFLQLYERRIGAVARDHGLVVPPTIAMGRRAY